VRQDRGVLDTSRLARREAIPFLFGDRRDVGQGGHALRDKRVMPESN
jgi:hypothetical protein